MEGDYFKTTCRSGMTDLTRMHSSRMRPDRALTVWGRSPILGKMGDPPLKNGTPPVKMGDPPRNPPWTQHPPGYTPDRQSWTRHPLDTPPPSNRQKSVKTLPSSTLRMRSVINISFMKCLFDFSFKTSLQFRVLRLSFQQHLYVQYRHMKHLVVTKLIMPTFFMFKHKIKVTTSFWNMSFSSVIVTFSR